MSIENEPFNFISLSVNQTFDLQSLILTFEYLISIRIEILFYII
jgi:hypothetical protein